MQLNLAEKSSEGGPGSQQFGRGSYMADPIDTEEKSDLEFAEQN